jgi:hypothetical protein
MKIVDGKKFRLAVSFDLKGYCLFWRLAWLWIVLATNAQDALGLTTAQFSLR